jgi:hypothetical protein
VREFYTESAYQVLENQFPLDSAPSAVPGKTRREQGGQSGPASSSGSGNGQRRRGKKGKGGGPKGPPPEPDLPPGLG